VSGGEMAEKELERALKLREAFHGVPADRIIKVRVEREIPKVLVVLGRCTAIMYRPAPPTKKKQQEYVHRFGDWGVRFEPGSEPLLCASPDGRRLFLIGGKYCVRDWIYG